jgi:hypothetical protein
MSDHAWIAGPVVGSIAGVSVLLLAILFFLRRTRQKPVDMELSQEKPQLDGEEIKPKETAGREVQELDSSRIEPVEMDTGYAGAEMNRHAKVKRKPVPQKASRHLTAGRTEKREGTGGE